MNDRADWRRAFLSTGTTMRGRPRLSVLTLVALAVVGLAGSAGARWLEGSTATAATAASSTVTSTFQADADARVHEAFPTTNYGSSSVLRVDGAIDPEIESYLRFTVSGIAGSVKRATLALRDDGDGRRADGIRDEQRLDRERDYVGQSSRSYDGAR
jgi:hypothetical protein